MSTLRDQILSSRPALVPVECPEWGGPVFVSPVSGADLRAVRQLGDQADDADLVVLVARDADGRRVFKPDDTESLRDQTADVLKRVAAKFLEVNGWGDAPKNS